MYTLLFTLFGWLPFFRPIYLWWHYKQMVQRLVLGGAKATLDDGYTVCSFFGVYLGSCCGCCCGHRILVFVYRHLHLEPAGIDAEEGEREMTLSRDARTTMADVRAIDAARTSL